MGFKHLNSERILPKFVRSIPQMGELLDAEEPEIGFLESDIRQQVDKLYLCSASKALDRYERIYALEENRMMPKEARRDALLVKHNIRCPMTVERLTQMLETLTHTNCQIIEHYAQQIITVKIYENDYTLIDRPYLERQIIVMKPAHIGYNVEVVAQAEAAVGLWAAAAPSVMRQYELTPRLPARSPDAKLHMCAGAELYSSKTYEIEVKHNG